MDTISESQLYIDVVIEPQAGLNHQVAEELFKSIQDQKKDFGKLLINYTPEKLDLEGHLCYHLLRKKEDKAIISGSGVYNGGRYEKGVYRVLNRSFVLPRFRSQGMFRCINSRTLLPYQIAKYQDRLSTVFVSREGKYAKNFLKWWVKKFGNSIGEGWAIPEGYIEVVPRGHHKEAFQAAALLTFQVEKKWRPKIISQTEWSSLESFYKRESESKDL